VGRLKPPCEKQDDDDNQDDTEDADAAMTIAIAVASEAATEPTEQRDGISPSGDMVVSFPSCGEADFPYTRLCGPPRVERCCNRVLRCGCPITRASLRSIVCHNPSATRSAEIRSSIPLHSTPFVSANVEAHEVPRAANSVEVRRNRCSGVFTGPQESLVQAPLGLPQAVRAVVLVQVIGQAVPNLN
jgi:hypothetical protein